MCDVGSRMRLVKYSLESDFELLTALGGKQEETKFSMLPKGYGRAIHMHPQGLGRTFLVVEGHVRPCAAIVYVLTRICCNAYAPTHSF